MTKTYNKVIINNETLIDLSEDTVEDSALLSGYTAHDRNGALITGNLTPVTDVEVDGTSVVTSGVAEIDLTGKADVAHTHTKSQITDFPSLATVAATGDYDDLTDKPTIPSKTSDLTNDSGFITGMYIASYGLSTYADVLTAYQANKVVYCRASSNSNPATGNQLRMAFLAYVNNQATPTEFEFQYYRSVSSHTASQQGDQVFVYKLNKTNGWSVTTREASVKVVAGTGLGGTYSNGTMTLTGPTKVSDLTNDSNFVTTSDLHNIPPGGTSGQVLTKDSATDYDVSWADASGGGAYIVTFTYDDVNDEYSCDKTAQEIYEAFISGENVIGVCYYGDPITDGTVYDCKSVSKEVEGGIYYYYVSFKSVEFEGGHAGSVIQFVSNSGVDTSYEFMYPVPDERKINNKPLSSDITLTASDIGALPDTTTIPSKTSDLTNDSNFVSDANYVHTDNSFTTAEKNKLSGIASGAEVNVNADWDAVSGDAQILNKPTIPSKTSDLTNDSGFITTETDPTVPSWAKQSAKPSYTFLEIGSKPSTISGYGITDAKISSGTITLGSNSITPLTSFTETDPIFTASPAHGISSTDISNWNGKSDFSGSYNDLTNKPSIPTITDTYSGTSSDGMSGKAVKSAIDALDGTVTGSAGSGKTLTAFSQTDGKVSATFSDISITKSQISDFPTIPTVNNATLTIQKNGTTVNTFTANASSNVTANITVPTALSGLSNDTGFKKITASTSAPTSGDGNDGDVWLVYTTA